MRAVALCFVVLVVGSLLVGCGEESGQTATETAGEASASKYVMIVDETRIAMREDASATLAALGAPSSREATGSCAYGGADLRYTFAHFVLQTYEDAGAEYIALFSLSDDTYATPEGIRIGDSEEAVRTAYGAPANETASGLTYLSGGTKLLFLIRNGCVTNIQYLIA